MEKSIIRTYCCYRTRPFDLDLDCSSNVDVFFLVLFASYSVVYLFGVLLSELVKLNVLSKQLSEIRTLH